MMRLALGLVVLTIAPGALAAPDAARAAGCEVLATADERAECAARAEARAAARAEVRRQVAEGRSDGADEHRSPAWRAAVADAQGSDVREALDARVLAAVGGLAWFALAVRRRWRARHRDRA